MAALKAVLAGFFGVRSRHHAEKTPIKLMHLIVVGVLCAVTLALILIGLARYIVAQGGG